MLLTSVPQKYIYTHSDRIQYDVHSKMFHTFYTLLAFDEFEKSTCVLIDKSLNCWQKIYIYIYNSLLFLFPSTILPRCLQNIILLVKYNETCPWSCSGKKVKCRTASLFGTYFDRIHTLLTPWQQCVFRLANQQTLLLDTHALA